MKTKSCHTCASGDWRDLNVPCAECKNYSEYTSTTRPRKIEPIYIGHRIELVHDNGVFGKGDRDVS